MDKRELELEYSPSKWSKRFEKSEEVIANHIRVVSEESKRVRSTIPCEEMRYGPGINQIIDVYGGDAIPKDSPIFVYIHGGYWQELERKISCYPVKPLFESNIRVVIVGYDLAPSVILEEIISEIKQAAEFILNLADNFKSTAVWFSGHSAGAHLCSTLLNLKWMEQLDLKKKNLMKGMMLISGIYDLEPLVKTYVNDALKLTIETARTCSAYPKKEDFRLKIIVVVGEHDSNEFKHQSIAFHKEIQTANNSDFILGEALDHFNIVENLANPDYFLVKTIIKFISR